ncbi:MAG: hypothetical protein KKA79_03270 [Nanoarchaeota archaeon]|nr:hypothetical protein [Nanoarchaeota archaeon]
MKLKYPPYKPKGGDAKKFWQEQTNVNPNSNTEYSLKNIYTKGYKQQKL